MCVYCVFFVTNFGDIVYHNNMVELRPTGKSSQTDLHWQVPQSSLTHFQVLNSPNLWSSLTSTHVLPFLPRIFTDEVGYYLWVSYKVCLLAQYPSCVEHPHLVVAPPSLVLQFPMSIQIVFLSLISFPRSWRNLFMPSQSDSLYPESCSGFVSLALLQSTRWGLC